MEVNYEKNNIVNLSNSILKYFGVLNVHNTLKELDNILNKNKYKNVVLLVCDGLGYYNLKELLPKNSFFRQQQILNISSVFPPTTAAATTTLLSGLSPSEHHWFGWDMYFKDTNETVSLFLNKIKDSNKDSLKKILDKKYMQYKSIIELINEKHPNSAYYAYPFSKDNKCLNLDEVIERIKKLCKEDSKKFIYAYIENPDKLMHHYGIYSKIVKDEVEIINDKIEELSNNLKDTLLLITADHGLISNKSINIKREIPKLYNMLERTTSIEPRACGLKLKNKNNIEEFISIYKEYLEKDFLLMTTDEVIDNHIFGDNDSKYLRDAIGDYLLIGITNKSLIYSETPSHFKANHAEYTKKEMYVPLIIIESK